MFRKIIPIIIAALLTASSSGVLRADDTALWVKTVSPDALILLDNSGSMDELPQGSSATFYLHDGTGSCSAGALYNDTGNCLTSPYFYPSGTTSCTVTGAAFNLNCSSCMPLGTLYILGSSSNCASYTGAYNINKPSDYFSYTGSNVYIVSTKTCSSSYDGPYYTSSGTGHTKGCTTTTYIPDTSYADDTGGCANGPFYRSTGTDSSTGNTHTTTCNKYKSCSNPFSSTVYSVSTDCSVGPIYRSSGGTHITSCPATVACKPSDITTNYYLYADNTGGCAAGPFYKATGTGHTTKCWTDYSTSNTCVCRNVSTKNTSYSSTSDCSGPYYSSSTGKTDCSKIAIAQRAIFNLMDYNNDGTINSTDVTGLNVRLGLERYTGCGSADNDSNTTTSPYQWGAGCEQVIWGMTKTDNTTTTPYANIYCNDTTCSSYTGSTSGHECVATLSAANGTPLGDAIKEGTAYLTYHKGLDAQKSCRQKSIVLITDGADTYSCSGNGSDTNISQRRSPVYYAKKAAALSFNVYVVGFGTNMPADLQNTLNWTAYYGNTRDPNKTQTTVSTPAQVLVDDAHGPCDSDASTGTDPASQTLTGYAFLASDPDSLADSLTSALNAISSAEYSFSSQAAIAAARVNSENYIYEASFEPQNTSGVLKEPFWKGHLKKYDIGNAGQLLTPPCWDAGEILSNRTASRYIWTYKQTSGTTLTRFNTTNMTDADLGGGAGATTCGSSLCQLVVGFYSGDDAYNLENWTLGDPFHGNPVLVTTPNLFLYDPRDTTGSYSAFYGSHIRSTASGLQLVLLGANDGQIHAFRTGASGDSSDSTTHCQTGGDEVWSFIPPNMLQKLKNQAHNDHTSRKTLPQFHDLYVDGPLQVSDPWIPSASSDGTNKSSGDWKTIVVFGEGQGAGSYLWSNSSTCYSTSTTGFSASYDATNYPYYCGFYALDVTDTTSAAKPTYLWHLKGTGTNGAMTSAQGLYLAQPWSKMQMHRVKRGSNERWVGFIGGGYDPSTCLSANGTVSTDCNSLATNSPGKGFYVVDLYDGSIIWSYTHADDSNMDFSLPASVAAVDLDNDGFIDTVYVGDLGGNMWRFRFCSVSAATTCDTSNWTGSRLFSSSNKERGSDLSTPSNTHKMIFTMPQVTKDIKNNVWVFFATGQADDPSWMPPTTPTAIPDDDYTKNRIYAIKESFNLTTPITSNSLTNVTSSSVTYNCLTATNDGWYYKLATNPVTLSDLTVINNPLGEKVVSDMAIAHGLLQVPTYVPYQGTGTACGMAGNSFDHKFNYCTAAESISYIGQGEASSVLVSYRYGYGAADTYVTASGGAGTASLTQNIGPVKTESNIRNILYWKDKRLQ